VAYIIYYSKSKIKEYILHEINYNCGDSKSISPSSTLSPEKIPMKFVVASIIRLILGILIIVVEK
jgi:hypothetical protein